MCIGIQHSLHTDSSSLPLCGVRDYTNYDITHYNNNSLREQVGLEVKL